MKSMPAWSAMRASLRQSGQLADQRSGTLVAERPDEQLAPNNPMLNAFALYIAVRCCIDAVWASTAFPLTTKPKRKSGLRSRAGLPALFDHFVSAAIATLRPTS